MTKSFLFKGTIFIIPIFLLFYTLEYIVDYGLKETKYGDYAVWNDIYQSKINSDLIILGSSRAWVHFSPKILDSLLLLNSYNLGMDGYNFEMQYYRFKIYLEHNIKPKYIILSLDLISLEKRKDLYMYQQFLPYLSDTLIRNATKGYEGEFNLFHYYLPYYKYYSEKLLRNIGFNEYFNLKHYNDEKFKGYMGKEWPWDGSFEQFKKNNRNGIVQPIENKSIAQFNNFLGFCQNYKIKVILVYSPEYYESQLLFLNRDSIFNIYRRYASKYNISFFDFSNDSISYRKDLFYNSQHLTKKGSELFSLELTDKLKTIIR